MRCWAFKGGPSDSATTCCASTMPWWARHAPPRWRTCGQNRPLTVGSIGTDGIDGPTEAAGAIADSTTIERARMGGLVPERFLSDNNAYAFFDALGDLINIGPTGTNVGDLQVILLA